MIGKELERAIGDAPDHIAGLRKLAVAFAIGGRFDGPSTASPEELLAQIETTREQLEKAGKLKRKKAKLTVLPEHLPEAFNDVTRFVPLAEIASIEKGKTGIKQAVAGEFPLVVTAASRESCDHYDFDAAAAIIPLVSSTGHGNASINRLQYQEGKYALGTILAAVLPHDPNAISARFLFEYLSAFKEELLVSRMTGTANVTLTIGRIGEVPVPLLSPEAQSKVDELMALCDRLEEARKTREKTRDKLTAASLARLTAPDTTPEDFPAHAAFALEALPALTTRPDQIKTLRQTILNLAVRGNLVEQDPTDEPASELVDAAKANMEALVASGEASKLKAIKPINKNDPLYSLPSNWTWVRMGHLAQLVTKGSSPKWQGIEYAEEEGGILFVTSENVGTNTLTKMDAPKFVQARFNKIEPRSVLKRGDILLNLVGASIGRSAEFDRDDIANINQAVALIRPVSLNTFFLNRYVLMYLNSLTGIEEMLGSRVVNAQPNISLTDTRNFLIPLPPLAEQHRIVAKVDALTALCDRLEAALTTTDTTRTRLLEALLHEALEPDAAPMPKAAE